MGALGSKVRNKAKKNLALMAVVVAFEEIRKALTGKEEGRW